MLKRGFYGYSRRGQKRKRRKRRKSDWHRSEFNNPYFAHYTPISLKPYLYFFLFSFLAIALGYFLLFSSYLRINSLTITSGNQKYNDTVNEIANNYLNTKSFQFFSRSNYFVFSSKEVKKEINNQLLVKNLDLSKKLPNKIEINFEPITAAYIWIQKNNYYNIDERGMIIKELTSLQSADDIQAIELDSQADDAKKFNVEEIKTFLMGSTANLDLPIIYNENDQDLKIKDYVGNNEMFNLINKINSKIPQQINTEVILYKINLADTFKKIEVITEDGWSIYLSADDLDKQIKNLYSIMQTNFKDTQPAQYIDLRYGNKLYYK